MFGLGIGVGKQNKPTTYLVFDEFNRADTVTGLGNPDRGESWENSSAFRIENKEALLLDRTPRAIIETYLSNCIVSCDFTKSINGQRLSLRYGNSNNEIIIHNSIDNFSIYKRVDSIATLLSTVNYNIVDNTNVMVIMKDSNIELYADGNFLVNLIIEELKNNTKHGIYGLNSGAKFDNYKVGRI